MPTKTAGVVGAFLAGILLFGYGGARSRAQAPVTFNEHVAPIVFRNCTVCHRPGESAPFPLLSYRDARPWARAIAAATVARVMPPWKAAPSDYEFRNARQLSADEISTIQRWVADGTLHVVAAREDELPLLQQAFGNHVRQAAVTRPGLRQLLQRRGLAGAR